VGSFTRRIKRNLARSQGLPANYYMARQVKQRARDQKAQVAAIEEYKKMLIEREAELKEQEMLEDVQARMQAEFPVEEHGEGI